MNFSIALSLLLTGASAFAPSQGAKTTTALSAADLNGWVADENKFAWGLPGSIAPIADFDPAGFAAGADLETMKFAWGLSGSITPIADFDPAGFAAGADLETMKNYRETETQHGSVAMLAALGLIITEEPIEFHPPFEACNKDIGPAIRHLDDEFYSIYLGRYIWGPRYS
jgi:hypothetical protein